MLSKSLGVLNIAVVGHLISMMTRHLQSDDVSLHTLYTFLILNAISGVYHLFLRKD